MKKVYLLTVTSLVLIMSTSFAAWAQAPIVGKWKTIDDKTNDPKSIVQIFENNGKYYGKIIELFRKPGEEPNPVCDDCDAGDDRKDKPVLGMEIIRDLERHGDEFKGGTILDPKDGKVYDCKLWVEEGNLKVRGYIAFFFRTQTWFKVQ